MVMKKQTTRRALVLCVLSFFVCVAMLVGTTFAWFTDSVTSGRNTIQSGNLDVALEYYDAENDAWVEVTSTTNAFGYDEWEPGFTKKVLFRVTNNGSLALKYQLSAGIFDGRAFVAAFFQHTVGFFAQAALGKGNVQPVLIHSCLPS
jgi:predicted ribosomally synthesized peptide with SipW-like signal peptide